MSTFLTYGFLLFLDSKTWAWILSPTYCQAGYITSLCVASSSVKGGNDSSASFRGELCWSNEAGVLQPLAQEVAHKAMFYVHYSCSYRPCFLFLNKVYWSAVMPMHFVCCFFFWGGAHCVANGILVPWPGLCPWQWMFKVLTTGPLGSSPSPSAR